MPEGCSHVLPTPPTVEVIEEALLTAKAHCETAGVRWTEPRRRAYELLVAAGRPAKAYDILAKFAPNQAPANPATVYRALDVLGDLGLVHRIESLNAFVACVDPARDHPAEFLLCSCCGSAVEKDLGLGEAAARSALKFGFRIDHAVLEIRGRCQACASADAVDEGGR